MVNCEDDGEYHRYFSVEPLIDEESKKAVYPLICTQCADLQTRIVDFKKLIT